MCPIKSKSQKKKNKDDDYIIYTETNRRRKIGKKYVTAGSWTCRENQIYANFLETHHEMFETEFIRRSTKVFRKISSLLRRRDPEQCRSHHQKLMIRYNGDIKTIIEKLKTKISKAQAKMANAAKRKITNQVVQEKNREKDDESFGEKNCERIGEGSYKINEKEELIPTGDQNCDFTNEFQILQFENGDVEVKLDLRFTQSW